MITLLPVIQRFAHRHNTVTPMLRMAYQSRPDGPWCDVSINHEPQQRSVDASSIDGTEIEQRPQRIGGGDAATPYRSKLCHIAGPMNHHIGQPSLP